MHVGGNLHHLCKDFFLIKLNYNNGDAKHKKPSCANR